MKPQFWMACLALAGASAVYAPNWIVSAQDETPAEESAESYENAEAAIASLNELAKESFANPRKPTDDEVKVFMDKAFTRLGNYITEHPDAEDHGEVYTWTSQRADYGYGQPAYVKLAKGYLKANPKAEDAAKWELGILYARLGIADEAKAAQADLKKAEDAAKKDAPKSLELAMLRLKWYDKTENADDKKALIEKLSKDKLYAESKDEWVQRRIHRIVFASNMVEIKDGEAFPDWANLRAVKDIDGKAISLADYKGKVILLDFWAVWCGPCMVEMPNVIKLYEETHEQGFEVIGISLDNEEGKYDLNTLRDTIAGKGRVGVMPWRQIYDGGGWGSGLAKYYNVRSIPKTVLIDQNGIVVAQGLRGAKLDEKVKELLAAAKKDGN